MALQTLQANVRNFDGGGAGLRKYFKKQVSRKRRRIKVTLNDTGGKNALRCIKGWMY